MKPFQTGVVSYSEAADFNARVHRHLPSPPPEVQIRVCFGVTWKGQLRAVAMLGEPVSPHLARTHLEVRRLASDGLYGACSALYRCCLVEADHRGRCLVTYTFPEESGRSLRAAGALEVGLRRSGKDLRKGRVNLTAGVQKVRWEWPPAV